MDTDMDTLEERVRMALAEAGYPNALVFQRYNEGLGEMRMAVSIGGLTPPRAAWMAYKVAGSTELRCWACWSDDPSYTRPTACEAKGQGIEDCGIERR